uniref:Uncharacterized protein n=1 Tax=Rhizophora mucronata TaxID=61149 RepID=A0A2P2QEY9_RHIMU
MDSSGRVFFQTIQPLHWAAIMFAAFKSCGYLSL